MKILVYNTAAVSGGALSILQEFYSRALLDNENEWIFIVSYPKLPSTNTIKIFNYPKSKSSWIHRFMFDKCIIKKIIEKHKPDLIYNLQNVAIKTNVKQVLYLHQLLPFIKQKISIFRLKYWIYKNIIGRMIIKSLRYADEILVQTNSMKQNVLKRVKIYENMIRIVRPKVPTISRQYDESSRKNVFFYPASSVFYKNHKVIIKACKILENENVDYVVIFTLDPKLNKNMQRVINKKKLKIKLVGTILKEQVLAMYEKSTLLFPSYIETYGLPLAEAKEMNSPIIAADTEVSREVLGDYNRVLFFSKDDSIKLADYMKGVINGNSICR